VESTCLLLESLSTVKWMDIKNVLIHEIPSLLWPFLLPW
jgi:hypothetical protein